MRLRAQHLAGNALESGAQVVRALGAVQAQDYPAAKWALAQRCANLTDVRIEREFTQGAILRTHILRPTWHFVSPEDIRWMLMLTGPRVRATLASFYRSNGLEDERLIARSQRVLARTLTGRNLARPALAAALRSARILRRADPSIRLIAVLLRAEIDGLICSGPRQGNDFTYALLDERVPRTRTLDRDEARAELARRYFRSHGPATVRDFGWWSGLTASDARAGLASVEPELRQLNANGHVYWYDPAVTDVNRGSSRAYLLGTWEELLLSYRDTRTAIPGYMRELNKDGGQLILVGSRAAATWRHTIRPDAVVVTVKPFRALTPRERRAIERTAQSYGHFLAREADVEFEQPSGI